MPDTPRLDTPHVLVTMADGREFDVKTENPDMVFFDLERARRKWPSLQEAPFLWLSYLAYSKLKRTGQLGATAPHFDTWILETSAVSNLDADGQQSAELESVSPIPPGREPG